MQYTIRRVPRTIDAALRRRARERGKSLNEAAMQALADGLGVAAERPRRRDMGDVAGTWRKDNAFERALAAQREIDQDLWR